MVDGARERARAYERIREEIAEGRQCFVVCPLVEDSERSRPGPRPRRPSGCAPTEFRDQRVELIHGQMPRREGGGDGRVRAR